MEMADPAAKIDKVGTFSTIQPWQFDETMRFRDYYISEGM